MKKISISLLLLFSLALKAQVGGNSVFNFLNLVPSARVASQGSNAIANPEQDLNFAIYNPSLLNEEMHGQLTFSLVDYVAGISLGDINYAHHFEKYGTFYAGLRYMDYGTFDRANVFGLRQGEFTVGEYAFNVGYGYTLDTNWSFGGNLKAISASYDVYSSFGMAMDLAATYQIPSKRVVIAFVAKKKKKKKKKK